MRGGGTKGRSPYAETNCRTKRSRKMKRTQKKSRGLPKRGKRNENKTNSSTT